MTTKQKPRLHLLKSQADPELFNADLDWFYGCYDAECGLRSLGISNALDASVALAPRSAEEITVKVSVNRDLQEWFEGGPWTDHHAQFRGRGDNAVFTRGRRVWRRLQAIPWAFQETLAVYYEARQLHSRDEGVWHDGAVFDVSAPELPMPKRRPSTFRDTHIERHQPAEALVRAAHRQYLLTTDKEAA